jgi:dihydroflavonol-4-reductase
MILVTGAAGLVGTALIQQLTAAGNKVRALIHNTPLNNCNNNLVQQVSTNILDVPALAEVFVGVTQVYHCAAIVSFAPKDKKRMFKINVEGTANVVNAALNAGVQKMVYVSSVAALGRMRQNQAIDETMHWTPETSNSAYGHSKFLAEMEVWRGIAEGLNAVIVNPTIILGNADWHSGSTKIFNSVYNQFKWYTNGTTGFVYVNDVAQAMVQLMQSTITAQRFIISADNRSYGSVFNSIAAAFGKPAPNKLVTPIIAALAWRFEALKCFFTGGNPLLTKETTSTALATVTFNNSKLLAALPNFIYTPLDAAIATICGQLKLRYNLK